MRGRYPAGWEYLDRFDASADAKERFRVAIEILTGACRVQDACARLGLGTTRLEHVREAIVAAALAGAERQRPGRPPRVVAELEHEVARLQQQVAQLEAAVAVANVRAELATTLPRVGASAEKKTPRPRRRPPGKPKS